MINLNKFIYTELKSCADNVSLGYPNDWEHFPCVSYVEEDNHTTSKTDDEEQIAYIRYRIDIWTKETGTSEIANAIDKAITGLGFVRCQCYDVAETTGLKHKLIRFEARAEFKEGDSAPIIYDPYF